MNRFAVRCTMPARWAHVGAMHVLLDVRDLRAVGEYLTIYDLAPTHGRPVVCCINGLYIGRADWWQLVRKGDVVVFAEVAAGGNTGRIIGTILVAAVAAGVGGWLAAPIAKGGLGLGLGWSAAAGPAVSIARRDEGVSGFLCVRQFTELAVG